MTRKADPSLFDREAAVGSFNEDKRTADVIWSTGARVKRYDWMRDTFFWEELVMEAGAVRLERLNSGAPLLRSHSSWDHIGTVVRGSAKLESKKGSATVRFSKRKSVDEIWDDVRDGIINSVSVGYRVNKFERVPAEKPDDYPVYRAVDWEPMEISTVAMPADTGAGFRAEDVKDLPFPELVDVEVPRAAALTREESPTMTEEEKKAAAAAEAKRKAEEAARNEQATAERAEADKKAREEATKAERARVSAIRAAVQTGVKAGAKLADGFEQRMIDEGKSVDEVRTVIFDELAKKSDEQPATRSIVQITGDERAKFLRGAGDWLIQKAGVAPLIERHSKEKVDAGEFRGMSLLELARLCLVNQGVEVRGRSKMELVAEAFCRGGVMGAQGTTDFAVLLENTLHKVLLAAYGTTPDTWSRFCKTGTVSDFRAHPRYRQGTFGTLDAVPEHGEFKNKGIPDGRKETISASTKGNIIALSRQAIINDDMGAFNDLATRFGRAARLSIEVDVYALLALNAGLGPNMGDGSTLFHANHANIATGAALSVAGIDTDRVTLASQKDDSGNEILDLRPAILVLPIGLGGEARVINDAQYDPDTANKLQRPNKVRGLFRDIVDTPRITGTRRYLFADPSVAPTIEVVFLDGQQEPFMDNEQGWRIDGVEWKVRLDYGVGATDYRGAVTNAGA